MECSAYSYVLQDAYMIKSYLESAGIETLIPDEFTAQVNNFYTTAIGGVRLMVRTEDLESGVALLKEGGYINPENSVTDEEILIVGADSSTDMTCCPFCGSENIGKRNTPGMAMVILYFCCRRYFRYSGRQTSVLIVVRSGNLKR